ncbi:unnamed protein product [Absidia cylindrospora]
MYNIPSPTSLPATSTAPSPFDYLLKTSSSSSSVAAATAIVSTPTSTVTPFTYFSPDQSAEFDTPLWYLDDTFHSFLAPPQPPASFAPPTNAQPAETNMASALPCPSNYPFMDSVSTSTVSLPIINNNPIPTSNNNSTTLTTQHHRDDPQQLPFNKKSAAASTHRNTKTFPCDMCTKVFHRAYNLKSHQLSHSKARPYVCRFDQCPWRFSRPHDLKRHEQLHSGGHRPYGCVSCGKRFAHIEAFQRHITDDATLCLRTATMLAQAASFTPHQKKDA